MLNFGASKPRVKGGPGPPGPPPGSAPAKPVRYVMRRVDIVHKSHSAAEPFTWIMYAPYVMIVACVPRAELKKC